MNLGTRSSLLWFREACSSRQPQVPANSEDGSSMPLSGEVMTKRKRTPSDDDYPLFRHMLEQQEKPKLVQLLTPDEIYAQASGELFQRLKEDRRIERKPAGQHADSLGTYFSMWANTGPDGGLIVLGMEDDGEITGCRSLESKPLNRLEQTGRDYCPDARCESKRIEVERRDGSSDFLLVFRVQFRSDKVVKTNRGEAYIRCGDQRRKLTDEEVREFEIDRGQIPFEQERSDIPYPAGFDAELIGQYIRGVRAARNLPVTLTDEAILELRHLGKNSNSGFVPNNACLLAFGKDPTGSFPGCKVRFQRFDGEREGVGEKYNAVKDESVEGPVPKLIVEAAKVIEAQLRRFATLGTQGIFEPIHEYPKWAWYEALVNACVHRSYGLRNMNIFVKMFDDRLVIESPGGFPPLVTPENIYEVHHPRNPHLMDVMFYLKYVQCAREGTRRMRDTMREMELPVPEFEQKDTGQVLVRVTLRNNIQQRKKWVDFDASSLIGKAVFETLTEQERQVINYVAEYKKINVSQTMRLTSVYWHTAKKILTSLKRKGLFEDHRRRDIERDPEAYYFLRAATPAPSSELSGQPKGRRKKPASSE
jgi:ATP-dependent DNA helicase RecG